MSGDPKKLADDLEAAVEKFDREEAEALCKEIIKGVHRTSDEFPERHAKRVLQTLRKKRYFDLMQRVADAFILTGQNAPQIRRQYAQALLDQSNLYGAIAVLEALVADDTISSSELAEARGLLGRAYKQFYTDAQRSTDAPSSQPRRNEELLGKAAHHYYAVYKSNPGIHTWHGVNAVAMLKRAERDRVRLKDLPPPGSLAENILATIEDKEIAHRADMWDFATAAEACLALGRYDEALEWLARYVTSPGADAFEFASTLRQFTEVWPLSETAEPGQRLLNPLKVALLRQQGGQVDVASSPAGVDAVKALADDKGLEKVFGSAWFVDLKWFTTGMEKARAVARVEDREDGRMIGTGFLVRGRDLHPRLGDGWFFMTNAHVITNEAKKRGALSPEEATLNFELLGVKVPAGELVWSSPREQLDATLVQVAEVPDKVDPYRFARELPKSQKGRVYVIGHPAGRPLSFSINDNIVLDHAAPFIHYRAPTEPGSSGSPVFNAKWDLVALHHAGLSNMPRLHGSGTYEANEGVWIQSIIERLREELTA